MNQIVANVLAAKMSAKVKLKSCLSGFFIHSFLQK
jgi:hypothetical protein